MVPMVFACWLLAPGARAAPANPPPVRTVPVVVGCAPGVAHVCVNGGLPLAERVVSVLKDSFYGFQLKAVRSAAVPACGELRFTLSVTTEAYTLTTELWQYLRDCSAGPKQKWSVPFVAEVGEKRGKGEAIRGAEVFPDYFEAAARTVLGSNISEVGKVLYDKIPFGADATFANSPIKPPYSAQALETLLPVQQQPPVEAKLFAQSTFRLEFVAGGARKMILEGVGCMAGNGKMPAIRAVLKDPTAAGLQNLAGLSVPNHFYLAEDVAVADVPDCNAAPTVQ